MNKLKTAVLFAIFIVSLQAVTAQNSPIKFNFKDFNQVQIDHVNGQVEIELGQSFQVSVSNSNNAAEQIKVTLTGEKLIFRLDEKYRNNWKNIKPVVIKIRLPALNAVLNTSNADVRVNKYTGKHLEIKNNGNGDVTITGTETESLEIENNGNGNVDTKNINTQKVTIAKSGNGDVSIKTSSNFKVAMAGNGDVVNYGPGQATIEKQSGNGKVVYRN